MFVETMTTSARESVEPSLHICRAKESWIARTNDELEFLRLHGTRTPTRTVLEAATSDEGSTADA